MFRLFYKWGSLFYERLAFSLNGEAFFVCWSEFSGAIFGLFVCWSEFSGAIFRLFVC